MSDTIRLSYASMVTPGTVYDFNISTDTLTTRKVQEIPSGYEPDLYTTYRINVPARDGVRVPVSIVHRKDTPVERAIHLAPAHTTSSSQLFFVTMSRYVTGSVATACSSSR